VADEQQERLLGRLFENLEQGVGGIGVERVGAVHQDDAPTPFGRRQAQEVGRLAHLVDGDLGPRPAGLFVDPGLEDREVQVSAGGNATEHRMLGRQAHASAQVTSGRRGHAEQPRLLARPLFRSISSGQEIAGETIGQGRLADAARTGQQPGVGQPPPLRRLQQHGFGRRLPHQLGSLARRGQV
jgi:hypothetical protein